MANNTLTIETKADSGNGFNQSRPEIPSIKEGADVSGTLLNKLGTSIPTPFARLHLFDSAFHELNYAAEPDKPRAGKNYIKLVSLAIDMLEFLYLYGDSGNLEVLRWNVTMACENLAKSENKKHKDLGVALQEAWHNGGYNGEDNIYLFKYGNTLIGGTSPLSLVYTNPNLNETFKSLNNNHRLFDANDPVSLDDRALEFRIYLYKILSVYGTHFPDEIKIYIERQKTADTEVDLNLANELTAFDGLDVADRLNDLKRSYTEKSLKDGNYVYLVPGLPLWVKDLSKTEFVSDYKIKPTRTLYREYLVKGEKKEMREPLVLNEVGIPKAKYVNDTFWTQGDLPIVEDKPIHERKLPKTEIKYPYLRQEDFFQDKIIELSYNIQKDKFYTGSNGDFKFLIPLKLEYFKYFTPDDLKDCFSIIAHETSNDFSGKTIKVVAQLKIPLASNQSILLTHTYDADDIADLTVSTNDLNIVFFPLYKFNKENSYNEYDILLVNTAPNVALEFFSLDAPNEKYEDTGEKPKVVKTKRNELKVQKNSQKNVGYASTHYHVDRPFDIVEVEVPTSKGIAKGLVFPIMKEFEDTDAVHRYYFGVDFGTTNTHIAFSTTGQDNQPFFISLNAKDADIQSYFLNNHAVKEDRHEIAESGWHQSRYTFDVASREFVSSVMPPETFPIRTAVCEVSNLNAILEPHLFAHMNIAFHYLTDMIAKKEGTGARYVTNIKWDIQDGDKSEERMRIFFEEMLLLMRNKAILNNGLPEIKIGVTYPQAMNDIQRDRFFDNWMKAAKKYGLEKDREIFFFYESVAPYHAFDSRKDIKQPYVNMDIGGGSTDILYLDNKNDERNIFSVLFAGNDIWGDGLKRRNENNSFLEIFERSKTFSNHGQNLRNEYENFKLNACTTSIDDINSGVVDSSDIVNFLFKKDKDFQFIKIVRDSPLMLLPILHFTALIYYLAHCVEVLDLKVPRTISFTGMGSLYLKMISSNPNSMKDLINIIFRKKLGQDVKDLNIIFADNPKTVTAEGALKMVRTSNLDVKHNVIPVSVLGVAEEDSDTCINFKHMRNAQDNVQKLVLTNYKDLIDLFYNQEFREKLSSMGFDKVLKALPKRADIEDILADSFDMCMDNFQKQNPEDEDFDESKRNVRESMFFWPLKDGLYKLGMELIKSKDNK